MNEMIETLLTVLALSQEDYRGPLTRAFPRRLRSTLARARRDGFVERDERGVYLSETGAALVDALAGSKPFTVRGI